MRFNLRSVLRLLLNLLSEGSRGTHPPRVSETTPTSTGGSPAPAGASGSRPVSIDEVLAHIDYRPKNDSMPTPGEVVWAWVPFEEDNRRGKDRPVVVLGEGNGGFYVVQLTSKNHSRNAAHEREQGRFWLDIGTGPWDRQRRPSEAKLHYPLWIPGGAVRREGGALAPEMFSAVVSGLEQVKTTR